MSLLKIVLLNLGICLFNSLVAGQTTGGTRFNLVTPETKVTIVYSAGGPALDAIAANLLAADIQRVSGYLPKVQTNIAAASGNVILIGGIESALIRNLRCASLPSLAGKWECYSMQLVHAPRRYPNIKNALVLAGSDARGTAYGVFTLSEKIGVSPWYWWADVPPAIQPRLSVSITPYCSTTPSVQYRGIFINDEDWGLRPWAASTLEPVTGNIGPATYAKVFELLLRLKANLIWPAMHPGTKAFFANPANRQLAADYGIIVGSSHAEPMLRNNVDEWDKASMGDFNYITNKKNVYAYWESRVKESRGMNAMYTMGMRGIHDSGLEGVKNPDEAVSLLQQVMVDQRRLLQQYVDSNLAAVPQVFTLYKEVLDIYDNHLVLPEDITLVWPDDNYGYIQRLNGTAENARSGGSGVYYHASYWGRPHDYLWLSTTHPALIREEMTKAYTLNARKVWVLNIGDIKPAEYQAQLFMDMAYDITPFLKSSYSTVHLQQWLAGIFGSSQAAALKNLLWQYYNLAFERKPEFMGWSQTEPTSPIQFTAYNHSFYGDQAQQRIDCYTALEQTVHTLRTQIPAAQQDAFYELVDYPVRCAAYMNKKFLYRDKAYLYARQGRWIARHYADLSERAYQEIVQATSYYNKVLAHGKWKEMLSMHPRQLPVFEPPVLDLPVVRSTASWQVIPEGDTLQLTGALALPVFDRQRRQPYFMDLYLCAETVVDYTIESAVPWIRLSQHAGRLSPENSNSQHRIWVEIDWAQAPSGPVLETNLVVKSGQQQYRVAVRVNSMLATGYFAFQAAHFHNKRNGASAQWTVVEGLGSSGSALEALPLERQVPAGNLDTTMIRRHASVEYVFSTVQAAATVCRIYTLPTYPLNKPAGMRYAVSIDNGPLTVLDFKTAGRSEEWKENVLSNTALRLLEIPSLPAGKHRLTLYVIDPGVILNRIIVSQGVQPPLYGALPETKLFAN